MYWTWENRSSWILGRVTHVSGQPIGFIFKDKTVQDDYLAPVNGKDRSSRNVINKPPIDVA
jgi:hypothetical protein